MFSLLSSEKKKTRRSAENWLRLAEKVYHYRRDLLKEKEVQELVSATRHLQETLRRDEDASRIRLAAERLEDSLRKYGGPYYRRYAWTDNVEVLLVAAVLAIGIRTYFVQPFKIPTNSMWPTYHGMTHEVFAAPEEEPGGVRRLFRGLAYGARRHSADAPVDGEVRIAINPGSTRPAFDVVASRKWLVFPGHAFRYSLYVGDKPVGITVPPDFQVDYVLKDAFFPDAPSFQEAIAERLQAGRFTRGPGGIQLVDTGKRVRAGESVLSFDLLTGDQLFVDRMSYHFVRPKIGDGIVFRTGQIRGLHRPDGTPEDKYYIKRLVGLGGDILEVRPPELWRNGERISGRAAFEKIQDREEPYTGYVAAGKLAPGRRIKVPEAHYFAMGDNSANSQDSRSFGPVPEDQLVGRSLFIYYPFTSRWGPAR